MKKGCFNKKSIWCFAPVIFWMGLIFFLSSKSSLGLGVSLPLEILARKWVHIAIFGFLALLFWNFLASTFVRLTEESLACWSIFLTFCYAFIDEFHQSFVPGRFGNGLDVILDVIGASLFISFLIFLREKGKKKRKYFYGFLLIFVIANLFIVFLIEKNTRIFMSRLAIASSQELVSLKDKLDGEKMPPKQSPEEEQNGGVVEEKILIEKLPLKKLLNVPFVAQAPYGVWDELHEEACEEASLIMVKWFLDGNILNKEIAEKEILSLRDYQMEQFGDFRDSNMEQLAQIAKDFYQMDNALVVEDFSLIDLKRYIANGRPVIIPSAGRQLGNPNFTEPGPLYHNLVLIGFDDERKVFITNDPGTRNGKNFEYDQEEFFKTIHDFPGKKEDINQGLPRILVFN